MEPAAATTGRLLALAGQRLTTLQPHACRALVTALALLPRPVFEAHSAGLLPALQAAITARASRSSHGARAHIAYAGSFLQLRLSPALAFALRGALLDRNADGSRCLSGRHVAMLWEACARGGVHVTAAVLVPLRDCTAELAPTLTAMELAAIIVALGALPLQQPLPPQLSDALSTALLRLAPDLQQHSAAPQVLAVAQQLRLRLPVGAVCAAARSGQQLLAAVAMKPRMARQHAAPVTAAEAAHRSGQQAGTAHSSGDLSSSSDGQATAVDSAVQRAVTLLRQMPSSPEERLRWQLKPGRGSRLAARAPSG